MMPSMSMAGAFIAAAGTLAVSCLGVALGCLVQGDLEQGLLMTAVSVFAAWMATAIFQFQRRIAGIDEVVRQARSRVEQAEQALSEMRQLSDRLRSARSTEDAEEDRTIH